MGINPSLFRISAEVDDQLRSIQKSLTQETLPKSTLSEIGKMLHHIHDEIESQLKAQADSVEMLRENLAEKEQALLSLYQRASNLWLDREVDVIAEEAQDLKNQQKALPHEELARRVNDLKKRISALLMNEALSQENRGFISLANRLLMIADHTPPSQLMLGLRQEKNAELAEMFFEISYLLFQGRRKDALNRLRHLSPLDYQRLVEHLKFCGGSEELLSDHLSFMEIHVSTPLLLKALIGFANELTGLNIYPTEEELAQMFDDLEHLQ